MPKLDAIPAHQAIPGSDDQQTDARGRKRSPIRSFPIEAGCSPCHHHQLDDGGHVRQHQRLGDCCTDGCSQLRTDDRRRVDVYWAARHRAWHLQHLIKCRENEARCSSGWQFEWSSVRVLWLGRHERCPTESSRNSRSNGHHCRSGLFAYRYTS